MADDNELTLKDPAAGKKKKLIMIVALVVILLGGGGAGAWFMFAGSDEPAADTAETKAAASAAMTRLATRWMALAWRRSRQNAGVVSVTFILRLRLIDRPTG